jgi:1-phosphofructokinase
MDGLATDASDEQLSGALIKLHEDGAESVLVSRAQQGALALFNEQIYRIEVPQLTAAEHRGAGDSMTAGVAAVLARGGDMSQAVRTGAAAGALNVTRHGLGTGHLDAVQVLTERVQLTPIEKAR